MEICFKNRPRTHKSNEVLMQSQVLLFGLKLLFVQLDEKGDGETDKKQDEARETERERKVLSTYSCR